MAVTFPAGTPCAADAAARRQRYASECITLGRFALRSRFVSFESGDKGAGVGCVGRAEYRYRVYDPYWMRVMNLLAHHAFWSGTGYRTTAGFGQTECWRPPVAVRSRDGIVMIERILSWDNLCAAWNDVAGANAAPGADGVSVARWSRNWRNACGR